MGEGTLVDLRGAWERSRLHGDAVTLVSLDDDHAEVRIVSNELLLYERTGHLRQMIDRGPYLELFETTWRDRARHAGWMIDFDYGDAATDPGIVTFRLDHSRGGSPGDG